MTDIRPDWRTLLTKGPALAARDSRCGCGNEVQEAEPIAFTGQQLVQEPDGTRHVDQSGASWICTACAEGVTA